MLLHPLVIDASLRMYAEQHLPLSSFIFLSLPEAAAHTSVDTCVGHPNKHSALKSKKYMLVGRREKVDIICPLLCLPRRLVLCHATANTAMACTIPFYTTSRSIVR